MPRGYDKRTTIGGEFKQCQETLKKLVPRGWFAVMHFACDVLIKLNEARGPKIRDVDGVHYYSSREPCHPS
jgi:hypothetical protein